MPESSRVLEDIIFQTAISSEGSLTVEFLETKPIEYVFRQNDRVKKHHTELKRQMKEK